jgi:hypothetical protein
MLLPRRGRAASVSTGPEPGKDRAATWLRNAMIALGLLAFCAAAVSWTAQYRLVFDVKHLSLIAALEAAIPDAAAFIFASLGIALALHGRRAIRPRVLNVAAVGVSLLMNAIAAAPGWRDLAVWVMPAVAYAVASDTLIGVIRAWALARARAPQATLADDEATPLAIIGGLVLWLLRLVLAPRSTLAGFRRWVVEEVPFAPGRRTIINQPPAAIEPPTEPERPPQTRRGRRSGEADTKTAKFLALVTERYGPLAAFPLSDVSKVCSTLAPEVDLDAGSARTALRKHVLAAQNGDAS